MRTIVFMSLLAVTTAATWQERLPEIPKQFGDKKGCYIKEIEKVVEFGEEVYPIGDCYSIYCTGSGINYASCGVVFTDDPNCHITKDDLTKPYPHCCPDIKCNNIE